MKVEREFHDPDVIRMFQMMDESTLSMLAKAFNNVAYMDEDIEDVGIKKTKPSKWALLVEEIEKDPINLGDYTDEEKKIRKEFRDNFNFKHDL